MLDSWVTKLLTWINTALLVNDSASAKDGLDTTSVQRPIATYDVGSTQTCFYCQNDRRKVTWKMFKKASLSSRFTPRTREGYLVDVEDRTPLYEHSTVPTCHHCDTIIELLSINHPGPYVSGTRYDLRAESFSVQAINGVCIV